MHLHSLAQSIGCTIHSTTAAHVMVQGLTHDSRQIKPGYVFVALPGTRQDGVAYIDDAIKRGAIAIVSESGFERQSLPHLHVANARQALADLACTYYGHPANTLQVYGITGTNGKTTTAFLIRAILQQAGWRPGLISTIRYEMGDRSIPAQRTTPEAPDLQKMLHQMVRAGNRSVVMEVSSHALAQHRVRGILFDAAIFTNLTPDHLDYHGDMETYFAAKRRLFDQLKHPPHNGVGVVNLDDERGAQLRRDGFITYGLTSTATVRAASLRMTSHGSEFQLVSPWGEALIRLPLLGRFNVSNALAAIAACGARGIDLEVIAQGLAAVDRVPGRMQSVITSRPFQVFIDYAHTEDALRNVLEMLRPLTAGRVILVFGCGGDRDTTKREPMGRAAAAGADFTWITTDNPRSEDPGQIAAMIAAGFHGRETYAIGLDRAIAIRQAIAMAQPGDSVLIAGKGHETYQERGMTMTPFDDAQVAESALQERDETR